MPVGYGGAFTKLNRGRNISWQRGWEDIDAVTTGSGEEELPAQLVLHREVRSMKFEETIIVNIEFTNRHKIFLLWMERVANYEEKKKNYEKRRRSHQNVVWAKLSHRQPEFAHHRCTALMTV